VRLATALALVALLAALPATATAHVGTAPADSAQKRKKPKKCKRGKIKVKVGKRTTCRPFKKAFPKPKAGDPARLFTKAVLADDWSRLRSRRGKRLPSLPKLIRRSGRGAPALLSRMTSRGFARLDVMEASAGAARAGAAQSGGCPNLSGAPRSSANFTSENGGTRATARAEMGPDGATLGIDLEGNGLTISVDINPGLCEPDRVEAPDCPTAAGQLDGQIRYRFKVAIQVSREGEDVWSQVSEVTRRTKLQGFNEVDAKLDQLNIEDLETSTFRLGGSSRDFPPITIRSRIARRTEVNMRSGAYDPGRSQVDATLSMVGLSGPDRDDTEAEFERRTQADADRQFSAVIDKAMSGYRSREDAWQTPPKCADMKFNAEPNTLRLRSGDSGSFNATAIAKSDGSPSELDAKLSEPQHATFSPTRAGGQSARFDYSDVVAQPPGAKVRVKVRATSKAGVAEGVWEQDTRSDLINVIRGTFDGSQNVQGAVLQWTGSAVYRRVAPGASGVEGLFSVETGSATVVATGTHATGCSQEGSKPFVLGGPLMGDLQVTGTPPNYLAPYSYLVSLLFAGIPTMDVVLTNCPPGQEDLEGDAIQIPVGVPAIDSQGFHTSTDGIVYDGSATRSGPGVSETWNWSLRGAP